MVERAVLLIGINSYYLGVKGSSGHKQARELREQLVYHESQVDGNLPSRCALLLLLLLKLKR
jgi:hypothetical protein